VNDFCISIQESPAEPRVTRDSGACINKMADVPLVLNDVLCFMVNKYVKIHARQLKSVLVDFYTVESLSEAKERLLMDVEALNLSSKLPHVPRRRDGEGRITREVDDLIAIFNHLDEQKCVSSLPTYVSANPDNMPSIRLFEGDMNVIMIMMEKLEKKVEQYGSSLSAISHDVSVLGSKVNSLDQFPPLRSSIDINTAQARPPQQRQSRDSRLSGVQSTTQAAVGISSHAEIETNDGVSCESHRDWATLVSTPNRCMNRFAVLASTTDDEGGYEVVRSRRNKRGRMRSSQQQETNHMDSTRQQQQQQRRPRSTLYGKSATATCVAAAKKLRNPKKSVYCVDNVSVHCTVGDITSFVKSLSVTVVSCFEVKPRRAPDESESDVKDRRAFRLCIFDEDRDRLLDQTVWPDSVVVSEWFFKSRQNEEDVKKRRVEDAAQCSSAASGTAAGGVIQSTSDVGHRDMDVAADATISDDTIVENLVDHGV